LIDLNNRGLFCRFAICNATCREAACITPIAPSVLPRQDRWGGRTFINPHKLLVFDLTPNVLGPSEGFSQTGYTIHAAIGFDPKHNLTWKVRLLNISKISFANPSRYGIIQVKYMMVHL
jgi:hypothetical protein